MSAEIKVKKKSRIILGVSAGVFAVAVSISVFFLLQIIGRMNQSANQNLLASSKVISEGLNNKITLDRELLSTLSSLLALEQKDTIGTALQEYSGSTDFFRFYYMNMEGEGVDSEGSSIRASDFLFDEIAVSECKEGLSAPYHGPSGHIQITYQEPVIENGKQTGAVYADRIINDYNLPALFTFHDGAGSAYVVDSSGTFIIKSRGTAASADVFGYLAKQGNDAAVQDMLREVMQNGKSGTLTVMNEGQASLLCFLPVQAPEDCYLITLIPRAVLQQEAAPIIAMLCMMFGLLLIGGIAVAALLTGRQSMKADVQQKEYREKLFSNLSANINFAFMLYTPSRRKVELVSDNLFGILGIPPLQVQERPEQVFDSSGIKVEDNARNSFLDGTLKEQITRESMVGTGPNQVKRWIAVHMIPADYGQYLAVIHETTSEHNMREQLADALTQAQNSNQARTAFFSSMSHDIRTPMNGIIGMTNIALNNLDNRDKVASCLNKITVASDHLLALINEVLDMSRIESGKIDLKKEPVHLPSLIGNLLTFIKPDLNKKGQKVWVESQILEHDTVLSDGLYLQKIMLNLLSNAVKYTQEGGKIRLQVAETPIDTATIQVRFVVEDNGIGMNSAFMERIFIPFERAEDSRMNQVTGTGLGLAITKNIVELMGGQISVESEEQKGSRFIVEIPLKLPAQQPQELPDLSCSSALIVDDDQDICESIALMLKDLGMRVQCVLSGAEAIEEVWEAHMKRDDYHIVILDWRMPGMDGLETARRIKERLGSEMPLLLLSSSDWESVEEDAENAGISGFLRKPIFKAALLEQLKKLAQGGKEEIQKREPQETINLNGIRILAAEDNELNREIIIELLESSGAAVDSALNGKEALKRYLGKPPGYYQAILMDIHMPEMNGFEATRVIRDSGRRDAASIPIIAMTADVFKEDIRRCMKAGMNAHIGKPLELDKLFSTLRQYINSIQESEDNL